ncbi:unnamed protein product, partial [Ectocarpus sp. 8 AP-2014]
RELKEVALGNRISKQQLGPLLYHGSCRRGYGGVTSDGVHLGNLRTARVRKCQQITNYNTRKNVSSIFVEIQRSVAGISHDGAITLHTVALNPGYGSTAVVPPDG